MPAPPVMFIVLSVLLGLDLNAYRHALAGAQQTRQIVPASDKRLKGRRVPCRKLHRERAVGAAHKSDFSAAKQLSSKRQTHRGRSRIRT